MVKKSGAKTQSKSKIGSKQSDIKDAEDVFEAEQERAGEATGSGRLKPEGPSAAEATGAAEAPDAVKSTASSNITAPPLSNKSTEMQGPSLDSLIWPEEPNTPRKGATAQVQEADACNLNNPLSGSDDNTPSSAGEHEETVNDEFTMESVVPTCGKPVSSHYSLLKVQTRFCTNYNGNLWCRFVYLKTLDQSIQEFSNSKLVKDPYDR
ncbi:hypothetical protein FRC03_006075 [Tulasnella sp. 419]|nr:hypothetical protein FRC03_006075 [Tulasnella sp. 419]